MGGGGVKWLSKMSFGIYLCHMVIYTIATKHLYSITTSPWMQIIVAILTLMGASILAWALYKLPYHKYTIGT